MLVSGITHMLLFIVLAVLSVPSPIQTKIREVIAELAPEPEEIPEVFELDQQVEAATEMRSAVAAQAIQGSADSMLEGGVAPPVFEYKLAEQIVHTEVKFDSNLLMSLPGERLIQQVPEGTIGESRAIVDDYAEAMDRITQELLWMLDRGPVLVTWVFDQSESMKDDQREIRDRIERVYTELGLTNRASGDHLLSAVVSYGENFAVHTEKPTSDRAVIRAAIDAVPVDPSGKEMTCSAVLGAVSTFKAAALRQKRQMALILVTDESGERENNDRFLEAALAEAKAANCRVYVLGREAVFGYPYAHMRWQHPQTNRIHWLRIDRGPETAFAEQLQTDGFRRRYDAFSSGYGPWEQTRLARETGGIFFMLPSVETRLVRGDQKRRYELEAMRAYKPDWSPKQEVLGTIQKSHLRTALTRVIYNLNPYNEQAARIIEMRVHFSRDPQEFVRQVRTEQAKATIYLQYLAKEQEAIEALEPYRHDEPSPRWQANYDLARAQIWAYQARIYEYGAYLEEFLKNPKVVPLTKPPNLTMVHWDITTRKETITGEVSLPYIERSKELFQRVIAEHPGTPYAARAEWELKRGFGVHLVPDYHPPYKQVSNPSPVPKL